MANGPLFLSRSEPSADKAFLIYQDVHESSDRRAL